MNNDLVVMVGGIMRLILRSIFALTLAIFLSVAPASADSGPRVLAIGDSLMAWHKVSGRSISHAISRNLGVRVVNRSVGGARMIYKLPISGAIGMNIRKQFGNGKWDWVVLNGGGNDLLFGCACARCGRKMDRLISKDGKRGAIPGLVSQVRQSGARVIYVGYLRTPGVVSPIEQCKDEGDELEARVARLAKLDRGIIFLSLADLVPHGDRSYHGVDMIHPSVKASARIGNMVADIIRENQAVSTLNSQNVRTVRRSSKNPG